MQPKTSRRIDVIAIVAVVITLAAVATAAAIAHKPLAVEGAVATGEFVNGVPVYRLPSVNVTASRKAELAKMAQEEAVAMARR
jgi:hypothetical protein